MHDAWSHERLFGSLHWHVPTICGIIQASRLGSSRISRRLTPNRPRTTECVSQAGWYNLLNLCWVCVWIAEFRVDTDIDGLSAACESAPGTVERGKVCLEVSSKVTPELNVLEAINTSGEGGSDADRTSNEEQGLQPEYSCLTMLQSQSHNYPVGPANAYQKGPAGEPEELSAISPASWSRSGPRTTRFTSTSGTGPSITSSFCPIAGPEPESERILQRSSEFPFAQTSRMGPIDFKGHWNYLQRTPDGPGPWRVIDKISQRWVKNNRDPENIWYAPTLPRSFLRSSAHIRGCERPCWWSQWSSCDCESDSQILECAQGAPLDSFNSSDLSRRDLIVIKSSKSTWATSRWTQEADPTGDDLPHKKLFGEAEERAGG